MKLEPTKKNISKLVPEANIHQTITKLSIITTAHKFYYEQTLFPSYQVFKRYTHYTVLILQDLLSIKPFHVVDGTIFLDVNLGRKFVMIFR